MSIIQKNNKSIVFNYNLKIKNSDLPKPIIVVNHVDLINFINSSVIAEISNISSPCYFPKITKIMDELYFMCNTTKIKMREFAIIEYKKPFWKELYTGEKTEEEIDGPKWRILYNPDTTLILEIVKIFLKLNKPTYASQVFTLFCLKYYSNAINKYIKHCSKEYFSAALSSLSQNHIFNKKRSIGNSIYHFSSTVFSLYKNDLMKNNAGNIEKMIYALRTRINQSVRSFANKYYDLMNSKSNIISVEDDDFRNQQTKDKKIKELALKISTEICSYGNIDEDAKIKAHLTTRISKDIANKYVETLTNHTYFDLLFQAYILFMKSFDSDSSSNSSSVYQKNTLMRISDITKKLMSIKHTTKPVYFKKTIYEINDKILSDINMREKYDKLSIQTKAMINLFIAYYLTLSFYNMFFKE